jgi:hypothetical protein
MYRNHYQRRERVTQRSSFVNGDEQIVHVAILRLANSSLPCWGELGCQAIQHTEHDFNAVAREECKPRRPQGPEL